MSKTEGAETMIDRSLAGACGLYCGACGIYRMYKDRDTERLEWAAREDFHCRPEDIRCEGCHGPLDRHWSPECQILVCAQEKGFAGCWECTEVTCDKLQEIDQDPRPAENRQRIREVGLETWLTEQDARWRCPACGKPVDIYIKTCRACGAEVPQR